MREALKRNWLFNTLLPLLLLSLTGCGTHSTAGNTGIGAPGSVAAKLVWTSRTAKTQAKRVALTVPAGVANVEILVTGTGAAGPIPVARSVIPADTGSGQLTMGGIYPGVVTLSVKATDGNGNILYEGFALNMAVTADARSDAGTITMAVPLVKMEERGCLACHETTLDQTGQNIVANYKQSGHYANQAFQDANGVEPGCVGCHGPLHNNPNPSSGGTGARCFDCHNINGVNTTLVANHGTYYLANTTPCSACHQMHNTPRGNDERSDWANSAHGSTSFPFETSSCALRCHNAKGFITFLTNPALLVNFSSAAQMVTCDACHTNAPLGEVRTVPAFQATYSQSGSLDVSFTFPDAGPSNLCIPCHSGRVSGQNIQGLTTSLNSQPFVNSHYRASAGIVYKSIGFQFYTSSARYADPTGSDALGNDAYFEHFLVGTNNALADGTSAPGTGSLGPCVACHMYNQNDGNTVARSTNPGHTLQIFTKDANGNVTGINNDICVGCHQSGGDPGALDFSDLSNVNAQITGFQASLGALQALLQTKGVYYTGTYPYFYTSAAGTTALTDWTLGGSDPQGSKNNLGAAFNLNLLTREPGAYAHNRYYAKRLIFDSIDWLQNGALTGTINIGAIPDGAADGHGGTTPVFDSTAATGYLGSTRP